MKTKIILLFVILIGFSLVTSNIFAFNTSIDVYAKKKKTTSNPPPSTGSGEKKDTQSTTTDDKNTEKSKPKEPETGTVVNPKLVTTDKTKITTTPPDTTTTTPPDTTTTTPPDTTTPPVNCKTSPDDPSCNPKSLTTPIDCTKNPDDPSCNTTQYSLQSKPDDDCLFKPSLDKCKPVNGKCPSGFGLNGDEQCFPDKPCPKGFERPDNDETGACLPITKETSDGNTTDLGNTTSAANDNLASLSLKNVSKALRISVSIDKDPIVHGNIQTIKVTVSEKNSPNKIAGASVTGTVTYASGSSENGGNFNGQTNEKGAILHPWKISPNATPGVFKVTIQASKVGYMSSTGTATFTVIKKGTLPPPHPQPPHPPDGNSNGGGSTSF